MAAPFTPVGPGPIHLRERHWPSDRGGPARLSPDRPSIQVTVCHGLVTRLLGIARVTMRTGLIQEDEDATPEGRGEIELGEEERE